MDVHLKRIVIRSGSAAHPVSVLARTTSRVPCAVLTMYRYNTIKYTSWKGHSATQLAPVLQILQNYDSVSEIDDDKGTHQLLKYVKMRAKMSVFDKIDSTPFSVM